MSLPQKWSWNKKHLPYKKIYPVSVFFNFIITGTGLLFDALYNPVFAENTFLKTRRLLITAC
jgi:hypothetical protein